MEPGNKAVIDAPKQSTVGDASAKPANNGPSKGRSTLHGASYHLHMAMVIMLRAYTLHREGYLPHFEITMEDPNAGKFDDVVLHYASPSAPEGTVYIQAKHKQMSDDMNKAPMIKESAVLTKWNSKAPYSIPMYFVSYLEERNHASTGSHTYMLCTNASIDEHLEQYLTLRPHNARDILSFCDAIGASCYSFSSEKEFKALDDELRNASLEKLGQLIATHVRHRKPITANSQIFNVHAHLVATCVEQSESDTYRFSEAFCTAKDLTSPQEILRQAFKLEFKRLVHGQPEQSVRWEDVQITVEAPFAHHLSNAASYKQQSYQYEKVDQLIGQFYQEFMFVCGSMNESKLVPRALDIMPSWVHDKNGTYNNLFILLFGAMKEGRPDPISFQRLKHTFIETNSNKIFADGVRATEEHLTRVCFDYSQLSVLPDRLTGLALYDFIRQEANYGVFSFHCTTCMRLNSIIVSQTLALRNYQCLIMGSTCDGVRELMEFITDVGLSDRYITTILGQVEGTKLEELKNLAKSYRTKIIIVEELEADQSENRLFLRDIARGTTKQFFKQHATLHLCGTSVALNRLVRNGDSLSVLCHVLKKLSATERQKTENEHQQKFNQIRRWYIPRSVVPYPALCSMRPTVDDENIRFEGNRFPEQIPFDSLVFLRTTTVPLLQSIMSSDLEPNDLPDVLESFGQPKVHIFLDEAGCGKSTYFTWLAAALSRSSPPLYVIRMNATNYSTDFKRLQATDSSTLNDTEVVRIMYRFAHLTLYVSNVHRRSVRETDQVRQQADRNAQLLTVVDGKIVLDDQSKEAPQLAYDQLLELRLFKEKFNERQCVLLLDGFDEIAPYYNDFVLNYLSRLAQLEGVRNLFISTRPYDFKAELKTFFTNSRMHMFVPFFQRDILLFLHNFFNHALDGYRQCDEPDRIKVLAALYIVTKNNEFNTIPLFMLMTLTSLLPTVQQCVSFQHRTIALAMFRGKKIDKLQMVADYVHKKLIILNTTKAGANDSVLDIPVQRIKISQTNRIMKRMHVLLAMCVLFDQPGRAALLSSAEQKEAAEFMQDVAEGSEKTGIIVGVAEHIPRFTHRIFAEYFAACWMHDNRHRMRAENFFRSCSYWTEELLEMRHFFDRMVMQESNGCDIHIAILNRSQDAVNGILAENPSAAFVKDAVGRLPLHLAISHMTYDIEKLLECEPLVANIHEKDELFHWTPFDYALIEGHKPAIEALLAHGATVNEDTILRQLYSNNLKDLLQCVTVFQIRLQSIAQLKTIADQMHIRAVEYLLDDRQLDIFTHYADLGCATVVEFCLKMDMIAVLKQFVSQTLTIKTVAPEQAEHLFQTAFRSKKAYEFIAYLVYECHISLPPVSNVEGLTATLKCCIKEHNTHLFKTIFKQLCYQLNFPLFEEANIGAHMEYEAPPLDQRLYPEHCCVRHPNVDQVSWPVYSNTDGVPDDCSFEELLATAVHAGSIQIVSYIVETTNITITNRLIWTIFKSVSNEKFTYHKKSMPAFLYLLDRAVNLNSLDNGGRNLLHVMAQTGCFFMLHCLLSKGLNPTAVNLTNGWNVLRYAYHSSEEKFYITLEYLKQYYISDWFDLLEDMMMIAMQELDTESHNNAINHTSMRRHSLMAMVVLFGETFRDEVLSSAEQQEFMYFRQQLIGGNVKHGIIIKVQENEPQFTHRVFTEYFGARWLCANRDRMNDVCLLRSRLNWTEQLSRVSDLFEQMIIRESSQADVHLAAVNQSEEHVRELLPKKPTITKADG